MSNSKFYSFHTSSINKNGSFNVSISIKTRNNPILILKETLEESVGALKRNVFTIECLQSASNLETIPFESYTHFDALIFKNRYSEMTKALEKVLSYGPNSISAHIASNLIFNSDEDENLVISSLLHNFPHGIREPLSFLNTCF